MSSVDPVKLLTKVQALSPLDECSRDSQRQEFEEQQSTEEREMDEMVRARIGEEPHDARFDDRVALLLSLSALG